MEKGQLFRTANLYRRGRGVMTSISEKLVSFCAKSDWKFEKCDTALLEVSMEYEKYAKALCGVNWEGRCPQRPGARWKI